MTPQCINQYTQSFENYSFDLKVWMEEQAAYDVNSNEFLGLYPGARNG